MPGKKSLPRFKMPKKNLVRKRVLMMVRDFEIAYFFIESSYGLGSDSGSGAGIGFPGSEEEESAEEEGGVAAEEEE